MSIIGGKSTLPLLSNGRLLQEHRPSQEQMTTAAAVRGSIILRPELEKLLGESRFGLFFFNILKLQGTWKIKKKKKALTQHFRLPLRIMKTTEMILSFEVVNYLLVTVQITSLAARAKKT